MKVLQVIPELISGGVERGTLELADHLTRHGHESVVISGGGRLVTRLEASGSRHITLPVGKKSLSTLALIPPIRSLIQEEQPDILHLRSRVPAWVFWWAWKKLPLDQRPHLVTTVHGFYSVNRWSAIMCCGERVICVSDSIRDYVTKNYPRTPETKLRVIPRGVSPEAYPYGYQASESWRERFESEFPEVRNKRLITLPGRITRLKGHEDLITIMTRLSESLDVHALIVGGTHPKKAAYLDELAQRINDAGLSDRVTFTGNRDDLREILSISTLVLSLTSQPESFGRTTLEALAMGIPVAGYAHGGVAEQLDKLFPEGKLEPLKPSAAAQTIQQLLQDSPPVKTPNPFTLDNMLEATVAVYQELLQQS